MEYKLCWDQIGEIVSDKTSQPESGGEDKVEPRDINQEPVRTAAYSPTQLLFLLRLARLFRQRQEYTGVLGPEDWRMRLLNRAIYSTYCDALGLNLGDDARALLQRDQNRNQKQR